MVQPLTLSGSFSRTWKCSYWWAAQSDALLAPGGMKSGAEKAVAVSCGSGAATGVSWTPNVRLPRVKLHSGQWVSSDLHVLLSGCQCQPFSAGTIRQRIRQQTLGNFLGKRFWEQKGCSTVGMHKL